MDFLLGNTNTGIPRGRRMGKKTRYVFEVKKQNKTKTYGYNGGQPTFYRFLK